MSGGYLFSFAQALGTSTFVVKEAAEFNLDLGFLPHLRFDNAILPKSRGHGADEKVFTFAA